MADSPRQICHLIFQPDDFGQSPITVRVKIAGGVPRSLGIHPNHCSVQICEPEKAMIPENLSSGTCDIRIGLDTDSIDIKGWRVIGATDLTHGSTTGNPNSRAVEWMFQLQDERWLLQGQRGGFLTTGLMNPITPLGIIDPKKRLNCSELVELCIEQIPLTYREGALPDNIKLSLDQYDPPVELDWSGAHAPTELDRLLHFTRHAFAFNQDGTYSIVRLVDPGQTLQGPDIDPAKQLPGGPVKLRPQAPEKVLITSAPTRILYQRKRLFSGANGIRWMGVDTDGSIKPLEDLSWWPAGKTRIQVFNNDFNDVAVDQRSLARSCVYRMFALNDADMLNGWTLVDRLVDSQADYHETGVGEPLSVMVKCKASILDEKRNMWRTPTTNMVLVEGVRVDLNRGVFMSPRPLVRLTNTAVARPKLEGFCSELGQSEGEIIFGHLPNAGDHTDYFMCPFEWDEFNSRVVESTGIDPVVEALADGGNVPVYQFPNLQLQIIDTSVGAGAGGGLEPQNETELKALALKYATAIITGQEAEVETREYEGLFDSDPTGSITEVRWFPNAFRTVFLIGHHHQLSTDFLIRTIDANTKRGGSHGAIRGGGGVGAGVPGGLGGSSPPPTSRSLAPACGSRASNREGRASIPSPAITGRGWFWARLTTATPHPIRANVWVYNFTEVEEIAFTGADADWVAPVDPLTGQAGNLVEVGNTSTGMLGIGISVEELETVECPYELRPIHAGANDGSVVKMNIVTAVDGDGVATYRYWFERMNSVIEVTP